ncbi:MAG: hypothetical protein J6A20_07800 [Muribaculaceae bacterium]|nr:hypothetical protein [Muribaculaceae bacterium]
MTVQLVILKAKQRADGSNKIRIAVSHNSATRYIPPRFVVDGREESPQWYFANLITNALSAIAAYCFFPKKPSISLEFVSDNQLILF